MKTFHQDLEKRWHTFSLAQQMANIGSEVGRSIKWKLKQNKEVADNAFYRCLELIDFTVSDPKHIDRLKEILRMREVYVDFYYGDNLYKSTPELWDKYFYFFTLRARSL